MATDLFLGIDVGTFETKGVLVDQTGEVVATARLPHTMSAPAPGRAEHDAETVWWRGLCEVSRSLLADPAVTGRGDDLPVKVTAVGVSAIGPCVLPTDADLVPLRPAILYGVDTRATAQIASLTERLGRDAIFARSGNHLTSQSAGPKILWLKENEPEVYERAAYFMTSQTFLVARLTGEVVMDHGTAGYFHPLYDLGSRRWDLTGCEDVVSEPRLPRLAWATEVAGQVTEAASAATGIAVGTPVIVGTTDAPAEAVSSSVVEPGDMMLMYGSSTYMIQMLDEPAPNDVLWSAPHVFPDTYVLAAGTSTAGTLTHWLADLLDLRSGTRSNDEMFAALLALAEESVPGAHGLLVLPYFSGERTPLHDPDSRGVIAGLTLQHTRADVARAVIEGVGHSVADALAAYDDAGRRPSRVFAVGGGTKNPLFLQTVSDIAETSQTIADTTGAAFGDALLAAYGVGFLEDRAAVLAWCRTGRTVAPGPDSESLRADHSDFQALYRATRDLIHARAGNRENS
ncbi:FGGY-family carbohydrate kinase [Nocardioides sp. LHG3406-4]|uniref:FGGY-family carbohydrate kinase n=1 Tax=Nocardioides sp. LHG3406-4 TaxID=2804575 RepID=UPI003CF6068E